MTEAPTFFVPAAAPESEESVYADFAKWCGRTVPPVESRIFSITYRHDGDEWTATVGETLRGIRRHVTKSKGKKVERSQHIGDPALVLAIFPGVPFMVVTNHRIAGNVGSAWENSFLAGQPTAITYFSLPIREERA